MALTLSNFSAIGFDRDAPETIAIDDDGRIAAVPQADAEIVDCKGAYLSSGWTDLHVHVWHGGTDISVRASEAGRATGVTAMADTGSAGEGSFHGLREYVIERHAETIRAFVNISSIGLVACNRVPELIDMRFIDVDRTLDVIAANRDVVCGVKVRASGVIVGTWGITPAKIAKRVAEIAGLPLMVHIGEPPPMVDEIFEILTPGDIVTHCFNGKKAGSVTDTAALFAKAKELAAAGVLMDIGHGAASFNFETARTALNNGLMPYSISTDLHRGNINGPVHDMATTVSKMLALGLPLEECVRAVAARPRQFLKLESGDPLAPGARADFTIFDVVDDDFDAMDSQGNHLRLDRIFEPRLTVIGASVESAQRRAADGKSVP